VLLLVLLLLLLLLLLRVPCCVLSQTEDLIHAAAMAQVAAAEAAEVALQERLTAQAALLAQADKQRASLEESVAQLEVGANKLEGSGVVVEDVCTEKGSRELGEGAGGVVGTEADIVLSSCMCSP
jgi:hypothetical protein